VRYQEILRRLAIIDEGFARAQAGIDFSPSGSSALDPAVAELVRIAALVAMGSPEVCLEWSTSRALAAGATEEQVTGVLLAVAPVIGLGRITGAAPGVAGAFGYDIETALEDPGGH
jgi:alkylhydroperoxidase/carboxymuconolactone decarboxylase family protein YurZ